ncbi:sulfatase family protein [Wocania ichthyoenteri]|uniref:sulfatase family protein n=1 Tax=Wocania ichthyoenteri TaxID=1230531 RepID=UPI00053E4EA0|nr:sulfatase-like hydrolase/transferase [Wocania ichthyoenteri]
MHKRNIFIFLWLIITCILGCVTSTKKKENQKPNIVLIIVDQLSAEVITGSSTTWVDTPSLDLLSKEAVSFTNCYAPFPLCSPSRASFLTGQYPSKSFSNILEYKSLGSLLKEAGYHNEYFGKWHVGKSRIDNNPEILEWSGLDNYEDGFDSVVEDKTIKFLEKKISNPFFLTVSFNNPHDCCELARKVGGWNTRNTFEKGGCTPDLSLNHQDVPPPNTIIDFDPAPEVMISQRPLQGKNYVSIRPTGNWTTKDWVDYRNGYSQLVKCVDTRIGRILKTLKENGQDKNTIVIFTSDHGDGLGEHGWNQKLAFYDQIIKVPLIIKAPEGLKNVVNDNLVNIGVDLLPTILNFAGGNSKSYPGKSLKEGVYNPLEKISRDYVISELDLNVQGLGTDEVPEGEDLNRLLLFESANARMITNGKYKYIIYDMGKNPEVFIDLQIDPYETKNLIQDKHYAKTIIKMKKSLQNHLLKIGDSFNFKPNQIN